ncbi:MAG: hypothetical protein WC156_15160 [Pedobacter sp.]
MKEIHQTTVTGTLLNSYVYDDGNLTAKKNGSGGTPSVPQDAPHKSIDGVTCNGNGCKSRNRNIGIHMNPAFTCRAITYHPVGVWCAPRWGGML